MEPYLQKGSKAIMFVNISPAASDESQSINSLKFASTARECRVQADWSNEINSNKKFKLDLNKFIF